MSESYKGPDRRSETRCPELRDVDKRLTDHLSGFQEAIGKVHARLDGHDARIKEVHGDLKQNCEETSEVLDIIRAGKGFFHVVDWLATAVKWCAGLAVPVIGLYYAVKEGIHK